MVDGEHVARTEAAAEEVDDAGQQRPPGAGAAEEAEDDENRARDARHVVAAHVAARDLEGGEEGQDVGNHHDEVGNGDAENRGEVLPQAAPPGAVAANLRHGVLGEDVDADHHHEDAADDPQQGVVLLDLGLQHGVEEEGDDGHEAVGAGHADARYDT